jgi:hypothetical protein
MRALLVLKVFDLPLDQIKCIDATHRFLGGAGEFALCVGQRFERLKEASPCVSKTSNVNQTSACADAFVSLITVALMQPKGAPANEMLRWSLLTYHEQPQINLVNALEESSYPSAIRCLGVEFTFTVLGCLPIDV